MESPGSAAKVISDLCHFEPADFDERTKYVLWQERVASFKEKGWKRSLTRSKTCNPQLMADAGWFCTGEEDAKCYACFKTLEGWQPKDNPQKEHDSHCPECPLTKLNLPHPKDRTLDQHLRLDVAIEFYRKKLILLKQQTFAEEEMLAVRQTVVDRIEEKRNGVDGTIDPAL